MSATKRSILRPKWAIPLFVAAISTKGVENAHSQNAPVYDWPLISQGQTNGTGQFRPTYLKSTNDIEALLPTIKAPKGSAQAESEEAYRNYKRFDLLVRYNRAVKSTQDYIADAYKNKKPLPALREQNTYQLDLNASPSWYSPSALNDLKPWTTDSTFHIYAGTPLDLKEIQKAQIPNPNDSKTFEQKTSFKSYINTAIEEMGLQSNSLAMSALTPFHTFEKSAQASPQDRELALSQLWIGSMTGLMHDRLSRDQQDTQDKQLTQAYQTTRENVKALTSNLKEQQKEIEKLTTELAALKKSQSTALSDPRLSLPQGPYGPNNVHTAFASAVSSKTKDLEKATTEFKRTLSVAQQQKRVELYLSATLEQLRQVGQENYSRTSLDMFAELKPELAANMMGEALGLTDLSKKPYKEATQLISNEMTKIFNGEKAKFFDIHGLYGLQERLATQKAYVAELEKKKKENVELDADLEFKFGIAKNALYETQLTVQHKLMEILRNSTFNKLSTLRPSAISKSNRVHSNENIPSAMQHQYGDLYAQGHAGNSAAEVEKNYNENLHKVFGSSNSAPHLSYDDQVMLDRCIEDILEGQLTTKKDFKNDDDLQGFFKDFRNKTSPCLDMVLAKYPNATKAELAALENEAIQIAQETTKAVLDIEQKDFLRAQAFGIKANAKNQAILEWNAYGHQKGIEAQILADNPNANITEVDVITQQREFLTHLRQTGAYLEKDFGVSARRNPQTQEVDMDLSKAKLFGKDGLLASEEGRTALGVISPDTLSELDKVNNFNRLDRPTWEEQTANLGPSKVWPQEKNVFQDFMHETPRAGALAPPKENPINPLKQGIGAQPQLDGVSLPTRLAQSKTPYDPTLLAKPDPNHKGPKTFQEALQANAPKREDYSPHKMKSATQLPPPYQVDNMVYVMGPDGKTLSYTGEQYTEQVAATMKEMQTVMEKLQAEGDDLSSFLTAFGERSKTFLDAIYSVSPGGLIEKRISNEGVYSTNTKKDALTKNRAAAEKRLNELSLKLVTDYGFNRTETAQFSGAQLKQKEALMTMLKESPESIVDVAHKNFETNVSTTNQIYINLALMVPVARLTSFIGAGLLKAGGLAMKGKRLDTALRTYSATAGTLTRRQRALQLAKGVGNATINTVSRGRLGTTVTNPARMASTARLLSDPKLAARYLSTVSGHTYDVSKRISNITLMFQGVTTTVPVLADTLGQTFSGAEKGTAEIFSATLGRRFAEGFTPAAVVKSSGMMLGMAKGSEIAKIAFMGGVQKKILQKSIERAIPSAVLESAGVNAGLAPSVARARALSFAGERSDIVLKHFLPQGTEAAVATKFETSLARGIKDEWTRLVNAKANWNANWAVNAVTIPAMSVPNAKHHYQRHGELSDKLDKKEQELIQMGKKPSDDKEYRQMRAEKIGHVWESVADLSVDAFSTIYFSRAAAEVFNENPSSVADVEKFQKAINAKMKAGKYHKDEELGALNILLTHGELKTGKMPREAFEILQRHQNQIYSRMSPIEAQKIRPLDYVYNADGTVTIKFNRRSWIARSMQEMAKLDVSALRDLGVADLMPTRAGARAAERNQPARTPPPSPDDAAAYQKWLERNNNP